MRREYRTSLSANRGPWRLVNERLVIRRCRAVLKLRPRAAFSFRVGDIIAIPHGAPGWGKKPQCPRRHRLEQEKPGKLFQRYDGAA